MMKRAFFTFLMVLMAGLANASYLYWQINDSATSFTPEEGATYAAQIRYGDTYLDILDTTGASTESTVVDLNTAKNPGYTVDLEGLSTGKSFYIEIVKYNTTSGSWDAFWGSEGYAYTDSASAGIIADLSGTIPSSMVPWTGGAYSAAPEPTSGLLMVVGLALLGLKRRKV